MKGESVAHHLRKSVDYPIAGIACIVVASLSALSTASQAHADDITSYIDQVSGSICQVLDDDPSASAISVSIEIIQEEDEGFTQEEAEAIMGWVIDNRCYSKNAFRAKAAWEDLEGRSLG
jgi:hypothetical protein